MAKTAVEPRFFAVEPLEGESISHFLGRFRRGNYFTTSQLGKLTGVGAVISSWEKFYLNPFPTLQKLEALAAVVGVDTDRLIKLLPPKGVTMQPRPIRLCGACYAQIPSHRVEWQFKNKMKCDRHQLRLLTKCTNCETPFPIPGNWVQGECQHCCLPFATMAKRQKRC